MPADGQGRPSAGAGAGCAAFAPAAGTTDAEKAARKIYEDAALARDIAAACGSCAHLAALRRTQVGPFALQDAAGADDLGEFTIPALTEQMARANADGTADTDGASGADMSRSAAVFFPKIKACVRDMDAQTARLCGFVPAELTAVGAHTYANGRPLKTSHFHYAAPEKAPAFADAKKMAAQRLAAFYPPSPQSPAGAFAGVVEKDSKRLHYGFVIPRASDFTVYNWEQIAGGRFNGAWKEQGCALAIGSFDGPHFGHEALFQTILAQENLIPGVITFSRSLRGLKNPADYAGDVASLSQKLAFFEQKGFAFAVVIDFSPEFARMPGTEFLSRLLAGCNMKFLVEGKDFCCGYRGATDVTQILDFSRRHYFDFMAVAPILYEGEKIGSSRIRQAVRDGDFSAAEAMLHHTFALDCAGWDWKRDGAYLVAKKTGMQVMPKNGDYAVNLALAPCGTAPLAGKNHALLQTTCTVDGTTVRFCMVTRTDPMWPGIPLPLKTLLGSELEPLEP